MAEMTEKEIGRSAPQATPEALFRRLDELGIETETRRHEALFTVEQSRALRGAIPGGHCKCLFLIDKLRALWLVVAIEDREIDLKALARHLGAGRFSFAKPELLMDALGVAPGAVTPFALINDKAGQRVKVKHSRELEGYRVWLTHIRPAFLAERSWLEMALPQPEEEEEESDPTIPFDKAFVLNAAIKRWSYDAPVSSKNIDALDDATAEWAFSVA
ncbi:MAG: hypothetical protein IIC07_01880, partial [Proteobacteria bacterium]|nr:hypothetical protein [Pseudomonadota bacterium]